MAISDLDVYNWAQQALDKFNGTGAAHEVNFGACMYLIDIRESGNSDAALAAAQHYLHCRYVGSRAYVVGAIAGALASLGYDGIYKGVQELIQRYSDREIVYRTGRLPPSKFAKEILAWDMQGLSDGVADFMFTWGNASLVATRHPQSLDI
jgi:hypothetical protein